MTWKSKGICGDAAITGNLFLYAWNEIKHSSRPRVTLLVSETSDLLSPGWADCGYWKAEPLQSFVHRVCVRSAHEHKDKGSDFNSRLIEAWVLPALGDCWQLQKYKTESGAAASWHVKGLQVKCLQCFGVAPRSCLQLLQEVLLPDGTENQAHTS